MVMVTRPATDRDKDGDGDGDGKKTWEEAKTTRTGDT